MDARLKMPACLLLPTYEDRTRITVQENVDHFSPLRPSCGHLSCHLSSKSSLEALLHQVGDDSFEFGLDVWHSFRSYRPPRMPLRVGTGRAERPLVTSTYRLSTVSKLSRMWTT